MRLYDPALVRRLRRAAQRRMRETKSLRRRASWSSRSVTLRYPAIYEPLLIIFLAAIIAINQEKGGLWLLTCLTLYCTATAIQRSFQLQALMTVSLERLLFYFYPLSDADFFHWAMQGFMVKTARIWLASAVAFAFVLGAQNQPWLWRAAGFATLQWLMTLAAIFALAAYVSGIPRWVPLALYVALAFVFYFGATPYLRPAYTVLNALPAGWIGLAIPWFHGRTLEWILWFVLTALMAAGVWALLVQFRSRIVVEGGAQGARLPIRQTSSQTREATEEEHLQELLLHEEGEEDFEPDRPQTEWQKMRLQLAGSQSERYVLSGDWVAGRNWRTEAWLERLAAAWMTPEERKTAEFLLLDEDIRWSKLWRASAVAAAIAGTFFVLPVPYARAAGIFAAVLSAMLGVPVLGGSWPATGYVWLSGKLTPLHGCYPLKFKTACRAMWKVNLVRAAAWLPIGAFVGGIMSLGYGTGAGLGALMVLKGTLVYGAAVPLISAGHFSKSTNDTASLQLDKLPLLGLIVIVLLAMATGAILTMAFSPGLGALSLGATALISLGAWWGYGRYYERGKVDLLRERK